MNREQRRAATKKGSNMASKRATASPVREVGTFRMPLENPERAGDISIAEAAEIKARTDIAQRLEKEAAELAERLNNLNQMRRIADNERANFMRKLLEAHDLNGDDEYRVNPEDGTIMRVARGVTQPEAVEEADAVEEIPAAETADSGG